MLLYEFKDGINQYLKASGSPHCVARSDDRVQQGARRHGDAVFRAGAVRTRAGEGAVDRARVSQGARTMRDAARRAGTGCSPRSNATGSMPIIAPSMSPAWPTDHVLGDHFVGAGYGMAAVAGTPSITVPIGDAARAARLGLQSWDARTASADIIALAYVDRAENEGAQAAAVQTRHLGADADDSNVRVACALTVAVIMSSVSHGPTALVVLRSQDRNAAGQACRPRAPIAAR